MITKNDVQATPAFKRLEPLQQKLILNKESFERIRNGVSVSGHKGLEGWRREHNPTPREFKIVTEILLNTTNEIH